MAFGAQVKVDAALAQRGGEVVDGLLGEVRAQRAREERQRDLCAARQWAEQWGKSGVADSASILNVGARTAIIGIRLGSDTPDAREANSKHGTACDGIDENQPH